jgi:hypothetical protein
MIGLRLEIRNLYPGEQFHQPCASTLAFQLLTISNAGIFVKRDGEYMSETHSYSLIFQYRRQDCAGRNAPCAGKDLQSSSLEEQGWLPFTMATMMRSSLFRLSIVVAVLGLALSSLTVGAQQKPSSRGRKYKSPPPTARIEVTVVRDVNDKPITNAAVIFHVVGGEKGNMELKTNEDGKAIIDVLTIGYTVRMQIIAKGFQTFGDDYKIDKDKMAIEIRMKRPGEQYSIYSAHTEKKETGRDGRFIAYDDGTVLDTKTNLMWAAQAGGEDVTTNGANTIVENYHVGGYTDWRMPTQDEMLELYNPDKSTSLGDGGGKPLHVATELINIDDDCYHADHSPGTDPVGLIGIPIFCFRDGRRTVAVGELFKVLPVRSAAPMAQSHSAADAKP